MNEEEKKQLQELEKEVREIREQIDLHNRFIDHFDDVVQFKKRVQFSNETTFTGETTFEDKVYNASGGVEINP